MIKFIKKSMIIRYYWKVSVWSLFMTIIFLIPLDNTSYDNEIPFFDKIIHVGLFAFCSLLLFRARMHHRSTKRANRLLIIQVMSSILFFGALIEIAQSIMDLGREGSIYDLLADFLGSLVGYFSLLLLQKLSFNN